MRLAQLLNKTVKTVTHLNSVLYELPKHWTDGSALLCGTAGGCRQSPWSCTTTNSTTERGRNTLLGGKPLKQFVHLALALPNGNGTRPEFTDARRLDGIWWVRYAGLPGPEKGAARTPDAP